MKNTINRRIKWSTYDTIMLILTILILIITAYGIILQLKQNVKNESPFFTYRFSKERNAILIKSPDNISISEISWFFPLGEGWTTKQTDSLEIEEIFEKIWFSLISSKDLTSRGLNNAFYPPGSNRWKNGYMKCMFLLDLDEFGEATSIKETGIPIASVIKYNVRGDKLPKSIAYLILIKKISQAEPEITSIIRKENNLDSLMKKIRDEWQDHIIKQTPFLENQLGWKYNLIQDDGSCLIKNTEKITSEP